MKVQKLFSDADLEAIQRATAGAETTTSGEIVPYIVERISDHHQARWMAATLGALGMALIAGAVHWVGDFWGGSGVLWITLPALVGAALGFLVGGLEAVTRRLVSSDELDRLAVLRAESAFLEEEVFKTRDRTGILIFLALGEHRAVVLADEGINRAVPDGAWDEVVADLVAGIKAGGAARALEKAVIRCGLILAEHRVERRPDDTDELSDRPRIRER
jgi:putative membrane protein